MCVQVQIVLKKLNLARKKTAFFSSLFILVVKNLRESDITNQSNKNSKKQKQYNNLHATQPISFNIKINDRIIIKNLRWWTY